MAGDVFTRAERVVLTLSHWLQWLTRDGYALDVCQFAAFCTGRGVHQFDVRLADIECFVRDLEARGRARPARVCLDRRATYIVSAFIAGAARSLQPRPRLRVVSITEAETGTRTRPPSSA